MMRRLALAVVQLFLCLGCEGGTQNVAQQAMARGSLVFQTYCVLCHGTEATGNGRAARLHDPRPVDLTRSTVNDAYRELIIRRGGEALGRSSAMPPWDGELSEAQVRDVIAYLRSIGP